MTLKLQIWSHSLDKITKIHIEQKYQLRLHAKITEIPIVLHGDGRVRIYCKLKNRLNLLMSLQGEKKGLYFRILKKVCVN